MKYRVIHYQGFGNSDTTEFETLAEAVDYRNELLALGGPPHFVKIEELMSGWREII